ncbi:Kae1-associated kinase Bud32 [Candidatus Bathyarchaeota archaeon]|nr:MAG: Kae1-associated kinase Bud32 [Candidatus Bathyarchaeota archaeon]
MKLLRKGAEANIYLSSLMGRKVVVKKRISKTYRIRELDEKIRAYRTIHEAQLLHEAKKAGVPTPTIFFVDIKKSEITMEYIEGTRLKDYLENEKNSDMESLCFQFGKLTGNLHVFGIIHGDLTTSNVILTHDGKLFLLDFGLGFYSNNIEAQGVDLYLLKQVFQSFHFKVANKCFKAFLHGYGKVVGVEKKKEIIEKLREIESRGRYIPPEARFHR